MSDATETIVDPHLLRPLVAGCGETGAAILACYARMGTECGAHDPPKGSHAVFASYGVVHVCTPASAVPEVVRLCRPDALVIVHASTTPGTCAALGHANLVHAPIEGRHPMLSEYLLRWAMPVSGPPAAVAAAILQLRRAAIPAMPWPGPHAVTELAKHCSTLRLGIDVLFMRAVHDACRDLGLDFQLVYREWTRAYNTVYAPDGLERAVLTPTAGPLGGRCLTANAKALASSPASRTALGDWIGKILLHADAPWNLAAMTRAPGSPA
ncbi:MAG: hypothetical protein Q8O71_01645 [bacterium]|nr:hypothetical protein [bacterium]